MSNKSRSKGKRGELQWRDFLRENGFSANRGQQRAGGPHSPDVICEEMSGIFHCEVKRAEKLNLLSAMTQAIKDSGGERIPYVAHRRNRTPWMVTMCARDWIEIAKEFSKIP